METLTTFRLPNGIDVAQVNPAETSLQYRNIFRDRCYMRHGVVVRPGDTVVDVGANIGISALQFFGEAPDVRILAFDPARPVYDALVANLATHCPGAETFDIALADRTGSMTMTVYPQVTTMSSLVNDVDHDVSVTRRFLQNSGFAPADVDDMLRGRHHVESQVCEVRRLSDVLRERSIARVDVLKVNVEKTEHLVLAGIDEEHWAHVHAVVMQVHDVDGRLGGVAAGLVGRGFVVTLDQDPLLVGTDIFELWAVRDR